MPEHVLKQDLAPVATSGSFSHLTDVPAPAVASVAGKTGAVTLDKADVAGLNDELGSVVHLAGNETITGTKTTADLVPATDLAASLGTSLLRWHRVNAQRLYLNTSAYIESIANSTIYIAGTANVSGVLTSDVGVRVGPGISTGTPPLANYQNSFVAANGNILAGFKAFPGQTNDIVRFLSSGGATLAKVDISGNITAANLSGINTGDQTAATLPNTPAGSISSTNMQAAINELDSDVTSLASTVSGHTSSINANTSNIAANTTAVANRVATTGDETIAGVKTFSSSPVVPTPTTGGQAATKAYVDSTAVSGSPDATSSVKGLVQLAGDLNGAGSSASTPKVDFTNDAIHLLKAGDTLDDGANLAVGTSTGTKLGTAATQKLGFFGVTPVVQVSNGTELFTGLANLGLRASGGAPTITTTGQIQANGPLRTSQNSLTGNAGLTVGSALSTQLCDATTAGFTVTLANTTAKGYRFTFVKTDATANTITITAASSSSINGATTKVLSAQYDRCTLESTGTAGLWYIIA